MSRLSNPTRTIKVTFAATPQLKAMLDAEAYEEGRSLSDYIYRLLLTRGKFARTVGAAGGYCIGPAVVSPGADD
jgi:hypothetical protein